MIAIKILQISGLLLNMVGVVMLAIFATPPHDLRPDGSEGGDLVPDANAQKVRVKRYWVYFSFTMFAYLTILLGFIFQATALLL